MNNIKRGWVVFTIVFSIFLVCCANVSALEKMHFYRFWDTTPGEDQHFYTSNKAEKAKVNLYPLYVYEGIIGYVYVTNEDGRVPLYRLYNSTTKRHIYTTDETEKTNLEASGWQDEEPQGYVYTSPPSSGENVVPLYHFYHTVSMDNFYTTSDGEKTKIE